MGNFERAMIYLFTTLVDLYVVALLVRTLLQLVRADFYNPVCQFLVSLTQPVLAPLRRLVPPIGRLDTAAVVLMLALEFGVVLLVSQLAPTGLTPGGLFLFAVSKLLLALLTTYFILIIAEVILSWVGQNLRHPAIPLVYQLTEPVLRPIRRVIPPIAGFDLSPIVALIGIRFLSYLLGW